MDTAGRWCSRASGGRSRHCSFSSSDWRRQRHTSSCAWELAGSSPQWPSTTSSSKARVLISLSKSSARRRHSELSKEAVSEVSTPPGNRTPPPECTRQRAAKAHTRPHALTASNASAAWQHCSSSNKAGIAKDLKISEKGMGHSGPSAAASAFARLLLSSASRAAMSGCAPPFASASPAAITTSAEDIHGESASPDSVATICRP
mmetsp:Transcript_38019/g.90901  ORF Transcript_38019/g.90901 Transcript_38019/m.90901 type:complete len:204 (-) Transcript_38019:40-651(-)